MNEKLGRNDPCPCGSGKKYKACCLLKKQQKVTSLKGRKITARVISGSKPKEDGPQQQEDPGHAKAMRDYNVLMERSFGQALHSQEEKPPIATNPTEYIEEDGGKGADQ